MVFAGGQKDVLVHLDDRVHRVSLALQSEDILEGHPQPLPTVGVPHRQGDGAGPAFPRAPAAGQVLGHGSLEVPHEERVDDGVHGAVAVTKPGEHVKEAGRDAVTYCLRVGESRD